MLKLARTSLLAFLSVAACSKGGQTYDVAASDSSSPQFDDSIRSLIPNLQSFEVAKDRLDLTVRAGAAIPADSEHLALRSLAERMWNAPSLAIRAETIAVTAARTRADGAIERSTYFYYRSERMRKR